MGKKKLAPRRKHSIPRLELSAAEEMADALSSEIDIRIDNTTFYTDSKAILGYTYNEFRHFCVNVSNRVEWIWKSSHLKQWRYLFTSHNPAYCTTRSFSVSSKYHLATWPSIPVKPATEPPPPKISASTWSTESQIQRSDPKCPLWVHSLQVPTSDPTVYKMFNLNVTELRDSSSGAH